MSSLSEASAKEDTDATKQEPAAPEQATYTPQPSSEENHDQNEMAMEQEAAKAVGGVRHGADGTRYTGETCPGSFHESAVARTG